MKYFDAHFHIVPCSNIPGCMNRCPEGGFFGVSCAHSPEEFAMQEQLCRENPGILCAYGIHPQNPDSNYIDFLEGLLKENRISAIGECGLDLFTDEFAGRIEEQKAVLEKCLELAVFYGKPVVFHDRKGWNLLSSYMPLLKKVPGVLFHSFAYSDREAFSILNRGINAYFSFGKQIIKGNKKALSCIRNLPLEVLLLETDSPYQTLAGEEFTYPWEIEKVYDAAWSIRRGEGNALKFCEEEFYGIVEKNYCSLFGFSLKS